jgi:cold shock CspA family protein
MTEFIGQVKWFNKKGGFGFITCLTDGEHKNEDIFVYHNDIVTTKDCFRYLQTGETVQFELGDSTNSEHNYQAVNVSGVNGAELACVRYQTKEPRNPRHTNPKRVRPSRRRSRTNGPVLLDEDGGQWMLVRK